MPRISSGLPTLFLLIIVVGGFMALLAVNATPPTPVNPFIPTQTPAEEQANGWQVIFQEGFSENSTPLPTIAIPTQNFVPPTLAVADVPATPFQAGDLGSVNPDGVAEGATPTLPPPSPTNIADDVEITVQSVTRAPSEWQPPPLIPPYSRDPFGRDHYWLRRPIDSDANNSVLSWYSYGSDGPNQENPWRVHHGIDMPNPIGETVRAAGSGTVVWSADGRQADVPIFQNSPSYGNVVVIEHDFGYRGQPIFTLYAHMSAAFVQVGQEVVAGEVIGLVGDSGRTSGSHVHFEVRMGENKYRATYNPVLWMVPYVGHGVIAGRIVDDNGDWIQDADITIRNRANLTQATTTSYIMLDTGFDVNPDPVWQENFVVADVPVGRYDVIATINGERVIRQVTVVEGTTAWVELSPIEEAVEDDETDENGG